MNKKRRCDAVRKDRTKKIDDREIVGRCVVGVTLAHHRGESARGTSFRNVHADGARSRVRERPVHLDEVLPLSRLWNAMSFEKGQKEKRTKRRIEEEAEIEAKRRNCSLWGTARTGQNEESEEEWKWRKARNWVKRREESFSEGKKKERRAYECVHEPRILDSLLIVAVVAVPLSASLSRVPYICSGRK